MSEFAFEAPLAATGRSRGSAGTRQSTADTSSARAGNAHLHAQENDRVYQSGRDQFFLGTGLPALAVAADTLPRDTAAFTGRDEELDELATLVTKLVATGEPLPIIAINGMPGVGKTTFAVHLAHCLSPSFPDVRRFLSMHAHTAGKLPMDPAEALSTLLALDGVGSNDIPDDVDGRSAVWRARMAGRRSILILDNVTSHQQVEPLLPGAAGCLVLVTSRRRLTGLGVRHAAATVPLSPLPPGPAAALFNRLAGRSPGDERERAVADLVRLCGYLPLAISLLAARLRPEPGWRVQTLVDELAASQDRLAHMRSEDIQVAAAFDLSYRAMTVARRRFFRYLGLHPGEDIDAYAAAALADVDLATARRFLDALYDDHLVDQPTQGRFRLHDLLGVYAQGLLARDGARQRDQAMRRLLDFYLHAAALADRHVAPRPHPSASPAAPAPRAVPALVDADQAAIWMEAELPNLLACASYAMAHGDDARLIGLSTVLAAFLRRTGPYQQSLALHQAAADAADKAGDLAARAAALHNVGVLLRRAGDYSGAAEVLSQARDLYQDLGDRLREADVLTVAGIVRRLDGDRAAAAEAFNEALARYRELADAAGQAEVLTELSAIHWRTDDYPAAIQLLDQAVALHRRAGNRQGLASALVHLGLVRRMIQDYPRAAHAFTEAGSIYHDLGARLGVAFTRCGLGVIHRLAGDHAGAARLLDEALRVFREAGDRIGEANALRHLGILSRLTDDLPGAARALTASLALSQSLGNRRDQAETLQELGVVRWLAGDPGQAADDLAEALVTFRSLASPAGQAEALNHIGALLLDQADPAAPDRFRAALRLARQVRNQLEEARALEGLGRCLIDDRHTGKAVRRLRAALEIYTRIGTPDAGRVRAMLAALDSDGPTTTEGAGDDGG